LLSKGIATQRLPVFRVSVLVSVRNVRAGNDVYLLQCEQDNASVELILPPKHSLEEFKKCNSKIM